MMRFVAVIVLALVAIATVAHAGQDDPRLEALFEGLLATTAANEARTIEASIWRIWTESGDEGLDRTMAQGISAMHSGDFAIALGLFDAIVSEAPDFAEGWNKRATLYYLMGEYAASVRDVEHTLALEPRHFGALSGMGLIHTALEDEPRALDWFERALIVNPHMPFIRLRAGQLRDKLKGEPI